MKFNSIKYKPVIFAMTLALVVIIISCNKDEPLPDNPYDKVDYNTGNESIDTLTGNTLARLHRDIFFPKCAVGGCHNGFFEPDFRSVSSSFATMVYHPIVKNNQNKDFSFRVVPYDTAKSVLYERLTNCCFVNQNDRMPQDNIGVQIQQEHIDAIADWIMQGARDMFGQVPKFPNTEPSFQFYNALDTLAAPYLIISRKNNRVDSIQFNSFYLPDSMPTFTMVHYVSDDSTSLNKLTNNKLKISYNRNDFSNSDEFISKYVSFGQDEFWYTVVETKNILKDTTVYMRYYTQDEDHSTISEFPTNSDLDLYKTFWSFIIKNK